uniref:uncharacterized protein LOC117610584 isoform X1 n=1 Tax=Osmia lignaria TaxID=473952 RepID=UPI0014793F6A|nr:uncharacterized protein LOC117610584 isoform X1 [Osmia lignaria]
MYSWIEGEVAREKITTGLSIRKVRDRKKETSRDKMLPPLNFVWRVKLSEVKHALPSDHATASDASDASDASNASDAILPFRTVRRACDTNGTPCLLPLSIRCIRSIDAKNI